MIDVSIVVASYETRAALGACLASVEAATRAASSLTIETIVIDNGSRDGSAAWVAEAYPGIRLQALVRNRGFAAAMNRGMRSARGRFILLLNSDAELAEDFLSVGAGLLDAASEVGVLGAALEHPDGRPQRSVHALPGWRSEFWPGRRRERLPANRAAAQGEGPEAASAEAPVLVSAPSLRGAAIWIRGAMLAEVGFLNESFFFFLEETEFCARARRSGYRVAAAPALRTVHRLGASSKRRAPLATRIEYHRSLYRYYGLEKGPLLPVAARCARALRGAATLALLGPLYPFSAAQRGRFAERAGLLLWHLRGCPDHPSLAESLESAAGEGGAGNE